MSPALGLQIHATGQARLVMWVLRIKLRSSCFRGKHLTNWANSSAPSNFPQNDTITWYWLFFSRNYNFDCQILEGVRSFGEKGEKRRNGERKTIKFSVADDILGGWEDGSVVKCTYLQNLMSQAQNPNYPHKTGWAFICSLCVCPSPPT